MRMALERKRDKDKKKTLSIKESNPVDIEGLCPGTEYAFRPVPPHKIKIDHVSSDSVSLSWQKNRLCDAKEYIVTCNCDGKDVQEISTDSNSQTFSGLKPGMKYALWVSSLHKGLRSKSAVTYTHTKTQLESLLHDLGLERHQTEKLTLSDVLQIDLKTVTDEQAQCLPDLPWAFLKKLMMVNMTARNVKCSSVAEASGEDSFYNADYLDLDSLVLNQDAANMVNPLDIVTALFLCSNGFLQQEIVLKMSTCQFSVPLLLPNCDSDQCTLMLWAMRDIVKKFRPHSLADTKSFVEERIVHSDLPTVSFVRLGKCSMSKSQILNKLLSNPQQYHDTFVYHDMECGDSPRRISNGLVEISWYLPCGNKNIDIFGEPVAVANLRGDIASFETQYSFLCQTSVAVFVFFDNLDTKYKLLTSQHTRAQLFLVGNLQSESFSLDTLKRTAAELDLKKCNVILKTKQMNDADFVKNLRRTVSDVITNFKTNMPMEQMADVAHELGILVDEDAPECQRAKQNAEAITSNINEISQFKEAQLPLQGQIWKELARLEKEECRKRKAGDKNIEMYKSELQEQKNKLRAKQSKYDISEAMTCFIKAISCPGTERSYFLKWMRMNLDDLSRKILSGLREQYKEKCQNSPENKEEIKDLDLQLSSSSLGTEHFLREMGQIYESAVLLSDTAPSRQQLHHLPKLCAELLLDGFPLELVDGDASNIPLRWVSDVLCQLNAMVQPKSKILVLTVLGVQSTGKSTLLNTMFGVQFAVSSGRCTRGAFMLLIKVKDDFKNVLNCDFLVIIDTEGLKSPEFAQIDESFEHDNELATLVVGLSDVTIINIAMENSTEMKDILQIVVHAFLRMKEVGKKPRCQFVHQNVSDVSAHDKNMRDRKLLLEQLNEMTCAAAKMEKKEENKNFTDVMEYNPDTGNWYIPGLWHGNPPMAPVNAGYSEAVYELKKNMIQVLGKCDSSSNSVLDFLEWTKSLWNAVKYENFIFSFRNSLVADAYMKLCTEFNKWEWSFKKHMYTWVTHAQTRISNFGTMAVKSPTSDMGDLLSHLKREARTKLLEWEGNLLDKLTKYFEQTQGNVCLVERYREDFSNTAKGLRREMENSVLNQLEAAVEIKQGMNKVDVIKKTHTTKLEQKVFGLIECCRKTKAQMTDKELDAEFEQMWNKTVQELSCTRMETKDIFSKVFNLLRLNLQRKGSSVHELVDQIHLNQCGLDTFQVNPEGLFKRFKHTLNQWFNIDDHITKVQKLANSIIGACFQLATEKVEAKTDYHDNDIQEILHIIEERLTANKDLEMDVEFEVSLKLHICGFAAREFQKMHEHFNQVNDPRRCLDQYKGKYCTDFKDLFNERDQCQKKAVEFTSLCLEPAVEDNVNSSLGPDIVEEMLIGKNSFQFSTRAFFQYSILNNLLSECRFESYVSYISSYEDFVKEWILDQIRERFTDSPKMFELKEQHLKANIKRITDAIKKAQINKNSDLQIFVEDICSELKDTLVIPNDALGAFMILNNADQTQFANWLTASVEDMGQSLREKYKKDVDVLDKLRNLKIKPQNELFTRVFGCGVHCPFCMTPCEAGGETHTEHHASVHRPKGLGSVREHHSQTLVTDICSSSVNSEALFQFPLWRLVDKWHPYKNYRDFFPNWLIAADSSIEASDYWKYVMVKFNRQFASQYNANPALIPPAWRAITKKNAGKSLRESFGIK
ncbi:interferon-induced very large GTPase 1-like [Aplochiton taeniatus]